MLVEPYQKHRAVLDRLDALVRGQALTCRGILHLEGSARLCACPSVLRRARLLGSCAVRRECYESEC